MTQMFFDSKRWFLSWVFLLLKRNPWTKIKSSRSNKNWIAAVYNLKWELRSLLSSFYNLLFSNIFQTNQKGPSNSFWRLECFICFKISVTVFNCLKRETVICCHYNAYFSSINLFLYFCFIFTSNTWIVCLHSCYRMLPFNSFFMNPEPLEY